MRAGTEAGRQTLGGRRRIGSGASSPVAMIAWASPAEAASVPWSISVHWATASILAIETTPEV